MQQVREKVLEARMGEGNLQAAGTACANTWVGVQCLKSEGRQMSLEWSE